MAEPKFQVGQHVAVCTRSLVVIPQTTVTEVVTLQEGESVRMMNGEIRTYVGPPCFVYCVAARVGLFGENTLRLINPDTEYQDISSSLKAPHSGMEESA